MKWTLKKGREWYDFVEQGEDVLVQYHKSSLSGVVESMRHPKDEARRVWKNLKQHGFKEEKR